MLRGSLAHRQRISGHASKEIALLNFLYIFFVIVIAVKTFTKPPLPLYARERSLRLGVRQVVLRLVGESWCENKCIALYNINAV